LDRLKCDTDTVLELGCFDGKLLDWLPRSPSRYIGFDANWEGGLDIARKRWSAAQNCAFLQASSPAEWQFSETDVFRIAVAMETLEHVPPPMVDEYLRKIAQHLDGYLFVTVPNEKGLVFLAKWMVKRLSSKDSEQYSLAELTNATLGRMSRIARREHKGFDYQWLVRTIQEYFDVIEVSGHPLGFLPAALCFGIGIVAKSRGQLAAPKRKG
jgi:2-polyprenyl-3-methyl-5-hydroxy-6-metoxy-1,4-benzoquinol methylase